LRLVHAIDNGRPLSICTTDGDYIGPPDLMGLSIAECTAHDASYMVWSCWEPAFREAFAAGAARYHSFLATNVPLLVDSRPVSDFLLVWPYENWLRQPDCITAYLARELSAANLQYDVVTEADLSPQRLKAYPTVAYSTEEGLVRPKTMETLRAYEQQGGHVVAIGPGVDAVPAGVRAESKAAGYSAAVSRLKEILDPPSVVLDGPVGVRAVVRRAKTGELLLHLYNLNVTRQDSYHDRVEPVENLRIVWYLPAGEAGAGGLRLQTPDEQATSGSLTCAATHAKGRVRLEFVVPKLKIWTIARLQAAGG
jgi:hypothetical protein